MFKSILTATAMIASSAMAQVIELPNGTKIPCRLEQKLSSATAEEGQTVQLSVAEEIKIGDTVVIQQGAPVLGTVTQALPKRGMGRTGKLDFSIDKVRTADGKFIPLRYTMHKKEGGSHATRTGVLTATAAIVFWPAAPALLLMKGKDVEINKGLAFEVFTDQDHKMKIAEPAAQTSATAPPSAPSPASGKATVTIASDVAGAEVEIDGAFVGSAPITRTLANGSHRIVVKDGGRVWERTLLVQGDSVQVTANLGVRRVAAAR